ncbi:hypothetical protein DSECCO2_480300 [anaerobic digester metagenome]
MRTLELVMKPDPLLLGTLLFGDVGGYADEAMRPPFLVPEHQAPACNPADGAVGCAANAEFSHIFAIPADGFIYGLLDPWPVLLYGEGPPIVAGLQCTGIGDAPQLHQRFGGNDLPGGQIDLPGCETGGIESHRQPLLALAEGLVGPGKLCGSLFHPGLEFGVGSPEKFFRLLLPGQVRGNQGEDLQPVHLQEFQGEVHRNQGSAMRLEQALVRGAGGVPVLYHPPEPLCTGRRDEGVDRLSHQALMGHTEKPGERLVAVENGAVGRKCHSPFPHLLDEYTVGMFGGV